MSALLLFPDPINREVRMTSQGSYLRVSWSSCEPQHPPSLLLQNFPHISQQALEFTIQTMYCPTHSSIIMIAVLNKANQVLIHFIINITHPLTWIIFEICMNDSHFDATISVLMVTSVCMVLVEIFFLWYCIIMLNANRYGWGTYLPVEVAAWYCTWIGVENNGRWFYRCPMHLVFYILKPLLWMINNLCTLWNWGRVLLASLYNITIIV